MTVCHGFGDAETVTCLAQAGFHYPADATGRLARGGLVRLGLTFAG